MSSDVTLTFINQSQDTNKTSVVIFQRNHATEYDEVAVAWTVIQNTQPAESHVFEFPLTLTVSASNSFGNYTPHQAAAHGEQFTFEDAPSGEVLRRSGESTIADTIELINGLKKGTINTNIMRDSKVLASKIGISPNEKALFQFDNMIYLALAEEVEEGVILDNHTLHNSNTKFDLTEISTADLVMNGSEKTGYSFELQNIVEK